MPQLHIPSSVFCPPEASPLPRLPSVPYASALRKVRENNQLEQLSKSISLSGELDNIFAWVNQDNNSAVVSGRIAEQSKMTAAKFNFMYFRIRISDYRSVVNSLAQVAKSESLFSEEKLRKWTISYKFRLMKGSPLKSAMRAFSCRLGIETDTDIVFCRDGFYGDSCTGTLSSPTGIPHQMLLGDITAQAGGLSNGSSIFVSRCTPVEREAAAAVLRVMDEEPHDEDSEGGKEKSPGDETSADSPNPSESAH